MRIDIQRVGRRMGIPHLTTYLRQWSELEPLAGREVVIDGPGFCFHIYHKCLGRREDAHNAFDAVPSYPEIRKASIEWLDGLRGSGAVVKKIYFDGYLPMAKLDTRLKRSRRNAIRLSNYHNAHSFPCRMVVTGANPTSESIFAAKAVRSEHTTLPAMPFLVPAILEVIGSSKDYMVTMEVVPGEADLYCAAYVKQHGGLVFTGDSDLLVHNLGPNGCVSFFNDIEASVNTNEVALQSRVFHPAVIAKTIGLPTSHGLLALAFEMFMNTHGTKQNLIALASNMEAIKANATMYDEFCKEYVSSATLLDECQGPTQDVLRSLDPRVSEIVLQLPTMARLVGLNAKTTTPLMFLPFLHDCPVRTSAWEMSTSVRLLAYGLINLMVPENERRASMHENRRQQGASSGREWQLPSLPQIPQACIDISDLLRRLKIKLGEASKHNLWLAAAIYQDLQWASSLDRRPLSRIAIEQLADVEEAQKTPSGSWDVVHFLAQLQGSYYSFRMLKQITNLVIVHKSIHEVPDVIRDLHDRLQDLPGLGDTSDLRSVASLYQRIEKNKLLGIAYEVLGLEEPQLVQLDETVKSPKKRKRTQAAENPSAQKNKSTNPFDALSED